MMECPKCHEKAALEYQDATYGKPMGRYQCYLCGYEWELSRAAKAWRRVVRRWHEWRARISWWDGGCPF